MSMLTGLRAGVAILATTFVLTACGAGDKPQQQSGDVPADTNQLALKYAQCMRDNGIELPDPKQNGDGPAESLQVDDEKLGKAIEACRKYAPKNQFNQDDPAAMDKRAKQTQCLREHGVEVQDKPGQGIAIDEVDQQKLEAAVKACDLRKGGSGE